VLNQAKGFEENPVTVCNNSLGGWITTGNNPIGTAHFSQPLKIEGTTAKVLGNL
jgi:hypothetical protein